MDYVNNCKPGDVFYYLTQNGYHIFVLIINNVYRVKFRLTGISCYMSSIEPADIYDRFL